MITIYRDGSPRRATIRVLTAGLTSFDWTTESHRMYAGSFDPITNGHADLIRRSLTFVDRLVVAVATNISKQPLFTAEERIELIRARRGERSAR